MLININIESPKEELELTDGMAERNDDIYNSVFDCIRTLTEQPDMEWDMGVSEKLPMLLLMN